MYAIALSGFALAASGADLFYDGGSRPVAFGASEIRQAFANRGEALAEHGLAAWSKSTGSPRIVVATQPAIFEELGVAAPAKSGSQAYAIRRTARNGQTTIAVIGADAAGAMYGALDVAEAVRNGTLDQLAPSDHAPHIERRGIKFNIPLDARTPTYSDNSDAAQNNIAEMWSFDFWRAFLDDMARHRYNVLTLWSLHPFPSIVKVPEFPDVALDDVKRTTVPMDDTFTHTGSDMVRPEMLQHLETVKTMPIGAKIQFWRDVMQYARDRGVEVYWFTWNIFTWGAEGKYGITPEQTNPKTIEYFRASVRETILTYPLLAGIGITAGEQMSERKDEFSKENWLWKAYGEGMRDAIKLQPGRDVRLIHRYHQTAQGEVFEAFKAYPGTFELSFKYAIAHMYSIPNPPFIKPVLENLPAGRKTWLTVRNDDVYSFRWGDLEYARAFVKHMPGKDQVAGFYMGPDGYIWGREFLSRDPKSPREPVIAKQWYSFMLWGRLSYEPDLPAAVFQQNIAQRFREAPSGELMAAWADASKVFPLITRFFWGDIDLRWLPEACLSHPRYRGFYTVKHFVEGATMPGSGVLSITEWRQGKEGITPLQIAEQLERHSAAALKALPALRARAGSNEELRATLTDMEAMAYLGQYYGLKIRGAAALATFDKSGKAPEREEAIRHLQQASQSWTRYARAYTVQYAQPKLYNRVGWVDIPGLAAKVQQDIDIARLWTPGTVPDAPRGRDADQPFRK
jgi:hypothetical protein